MPKQDLEYYLNEILSMGGIVKIANQDLFSDNVDTWIVELEMYGACGDPEEELPMIGSASLQGHNLLSLIQSCTTIAHEIVHSADEDYSIADEIREFLGEKKADCDFDCDCHLDE